MKGPYWYAIYEYNISTNNFCCSVPKKQQNGEKRIIGNAGFVPEKSILGNAYENGNTEATDIAMNETEM